MTFGLHLNRTAACQDEGAAEHRGCGEQPMQPPRRHAIRVRAVAPLIGPVRCADLVVIPASASGEGECHQGISQEDLHRVAAQTKPAIRIEQSAQKKLHMAVCGAVWDGCPKPAIFDHMTVRETLEKTLHGAPKPVTKDAEDFGPRGGCAPNSAARCCRMRSATGRRASPDRYPTRRTKAHVRSRDAGLYWTMVLSIPWHRWDDGNRSHRRPISGSSRTI